MATQKYTVILPSEWDRSRVVMEKPVTKKIAVSKTSTISLTKSANNYLNDDGEPVKLYIQAPTQRIGAFALVYSHEIKMDIEKRTTTNAEGAQLVYPMTSFDTVKDPTPEEQEFIDVVNDIWKLTCEHAKKMFEEDKKAEKKDKFLPGPSRTSIGAVLSADKGNQDWKEAVKFPYERPNIKDSNPKRRDESKPYNLYCKFASRGKGEKLQIFAKFYVKDDDGVVTTRNAGSFLGEPNKPGKSGIISPVLMWDDTYWGQHGDTSCGVSPKLKLVEADFEETAGQDGVPKERISRRPLPAIADKPAPAKKSPERKIAMKKSIAADSSEDEDETEPHKSNGKEEKTPKKEDKKSSEKKSKKSSEKGKKKGKKEESGEDEEDF